MSVGYHHDFYRLFIYCLHLANMITGIIRDNPFLTESNHKPLNDLSLTILYPRATMTVD